MWIDANPDTYAYSHSHTNAYSYTHANPYPDTNTNSYTHADSVVFALCRRHFICAQPGRHQ